MTGLSGKLLWSRGSSSGIGRATAVALAANGAHVLVGDRDEQRAKDMVADIDASFVEGVTLAVDGGWVAT